MTLQEKVSDILNKATAEKQPLPSLRNIRAKLGSGSLTTISEAVKEWKLAQLQTSGDLPTITEKEQIEAGQAIWNTFLPFLQRHIETVKENALKRVEIEKSEAEKLRLTCDELLAEAQAKENTAQQALDQTHKLETENSALKLKIDDLSRQINHLKQEINNLCEHEQQLQANLDIEKQHNIDAQAVIRTLKELLPNLHPGKQGK